MHTAHHNTTLQFKIVKKLIKVSNAVLFIKFTPYVCAKYQMYAQLFTANIKFRIQGLFNPN